MRTSRRDHAVMRSVRIARECAGASAI